MDPTSKPWRCSSEALQHAIDQGWVIIEAGHSVALTDHGRQRVKG